MLMRACRAAVIFPSHAHRQRHSISIAAASSQNSRAQQTGSGAVAASSSKGAMSEGGNEAQNPLPLPGAKSSSSSDWWGSNSQRKGSFGGFSQGSSSLEPPRLQEYGKKRDDILSVGNFSSGRPPSSHVPSRSIQEGRSSWEQPDRRDLASLQLPPLDLADDNEFPMLGAAPAKPKKAAATAAAVAVVKQTPVLMTPVQTSQQSLRTQEGDSYSFAQNQRSNNNNNNNNITVSEPLPYHDRGGRAGGGGGGRGGGGRGITAMDPIDALGRTLTAILRHRAADFKLKLRRDGYVAVDEILKLSMKTMAGNPLNSHSEDDLRKTVKEDRKQRFGLLEEGGQLFIRANQGHTISTVESELLLKPITSAEEIPVCVHGTYAKFMDQIWEQGLKRMKRNHIHFATGLPKEDGVISGMRGTADILIYLDVKKALTAGMKLYMSENRVILTEGFDGAVPPDYFNKVLKLKWPEKKEYVHVAAPSWLQKKNPLKSDDGGVETTTSTSTVVAADQPP